MNYTLHQLRVFLKVSEKQSITRASEELYLTQPAVSIQLKKLQEQFDVPLFEVIGRQIYITDFGKELVASSQQIIDQVDEIKYKSLAYKGLLFGKLKISVVSTGKYVMPYFLSDFASQHPDVELIMDVTNRTQVIRSLEKNETDFALVSLLPDSLSIERIELMQNKLYLVRSSDLADSASNTMYVKSLENVPLIYREEGSATRQAMEHFMTSNNIPLKKTIELTSNEAVKQAVLAGLGYSIMPLIGIKNELLSGALSIVQVKGLPLTTHWNLIWLKEKKHKPTAEAYLSFLNENKEKVIHDRFNWYEDY